MISKLIEYSIRNRFIVILLTMCVAAWGIYCLMRTPVDAIPDLSESQVIVFTDWMGRSPQEIDDQITYPLSVNLQGLAGVKSIRSSSEFNFSMINIIFDEHTDFYFARTRVLERLSVAGTFLPPGVVPYLAPDSTALGQIFWYTVEGDGYSLDQLRSIQDWYVRYQLYVSGVSEVASVGGFVREYQIDVDPAKLRAFDVTLGQLFNAVAQSNSAVGGKVFVEAKAEFLIRGIGWLRGVRDIEDITVAARNGVPIRIRQLAAVQLGPQFRRSILEKNGAEAVGGVVLMRFGENPLGVTRAIKARIEQLQPGLPAGVRIIPFYDRTRLIQDAIHTLTDTLLEELIVASLAVILVLRHIRSALIVCVTLPLAVLVAFIFMYHMQIPSNIMSLSGIAISIGLFVDASVVMVENTTHELRRRFGDQPVRGDTTEIVVESCRLVGRPIFFAVLIMLISFIPVFALGGIEGKMFHPLAWTKTLAMVGVALLAVTFVPAVIPLLVKGRLQRESDNWFVRTFIDIYKPVLSWLLDVPAAGIWFMAFLFVVGVGFIGNQTLFMLVTVAALFCGAVFFRRAWSQALALALLLVTAVWSWNFPKLGYEFMPPLDEGSILDMPVTVPRVSAAQAADDIRARDAIMRGFPEVDQIVGKVGRAETPTDPSGLDMVETVVSLRPNRWWTKRCVRFEDVAAIGGRMAEALQEVGAIRRDVTLEQRERLVNAATMEAITDLNRRLRELARRRQIEFEPELARRVVANTMQELLGLATARGRLSRPPSAVELDHLARELSTDIGRSLASVPRREEMGRLLSALTQRLVQLKVIDSATDFLLPAASVGRSIQDAWSTVLGTERSTLNSEFLEKCEQWLDGAWVDHARTLNWELEADAFSSLAERMLTRLEEQSRAREYLADSLAPEQRRRLIADSASRFPSELFLWRASKSDLLKELDSEVQMPGWGNIWTQPIINRVDMLATGVRTMIGVKVYGPRLADKEEDVVENGVARRVTRPGIQQVANQVAAVLRAIPGAVDVFPDQMIGRSYLNVDVNREKAARYGISVSDIQEVVEVAMGGKPVTFTVESRERYPVRIRYARDFWQSRDVLKRILVAGRSNRDSMNAQPGGGDMARARSGPPDETSPQIPLTEVADISVVEGPSVIKSENGVLRAYVQLNVRDRDIVGFVEEARQAVADRVKLPPGFFIEWSGQFEHQVRARHTLQVIFPIVVLLMFVILYVTFNDFRDACLIMLAVPGAIVGGVIFQNLFGFHFSVAVWIGYIACFGEATQTGIVMLVYLHDAITARGGLRGIQSLGELRQTILEGAVHRLRPKLITEGCAIIGLMPMLWATGVGAEVMRPMAAPVLGGLLVADEVIDLLLPVIFHWYNRREWQRLRDVR